MILLTSTSDLITVVTASGVTSITVHASWIDYSAGTITPGRTNTIPITTATTTTVVAAPASSTQRNVKSLVIHNTHASSSNAITVNHTDGSNVETLLQYTLLASESIQYFDGIGFEVIDAAGGRKVTPATGRFRSVTVHTSGTTHTTAADTNTIKVYVVAGGGQGGGGLGGSSTASAGGGGAAGGYAEKTFAVSPNTAYTYAIGAGGSTSTGQTTGQTGGNSTFAVGATTVTAFGGLGGSGGGAQASTVLTVLGGAAPAISTNGDVNGSGDPGSPGIRLSGTIAVSGNGGSCPFGAGGVGVITDVAGNVSIGFGGGGGGATSLTAANRNGGAGTGGIIIVEEYS
jgi:hypothetical protein